MRTFAQVVGWLIIILSAGGGLVMCGQASDTYDGSGAVIGAIGFASALVGIAFSLIILLLASIDRRLEDANRSPAPRAPSRPKMADFSDSEAKADNKMTGAA